MKLKYFSIPVLALALHSCSGESGEPTPAPAEGQKIAILVMAGNDNEGTRAGRQLTSSETASDIDEVSMAIYSLNDDNSIGSRVFSRTLNWKDSIAGLTDGQMVHVNLKNVPELSGSAGLPDGRYAIVATGYSSTRTYSLTPGADGLNSVSPVMKALFPGEAAGEEIFAGSIPEVVVSGSRFTTGGSDGGFKTIVLSRQTAGTFGYFKNIPATGFDGTEATHLRLVASGKNNLLILGAFDSNSDIVNGSRSGDIHPDGEFAGGAGGYVVYETALRDWFPRGDVNNDGVLNDKDANFNGMSGNWKVPSWLDGKIMLKQGTVFCSNFVVPFLSNGTSTFELQLTAKAGNGSTTILRRWAVNCGDLQENIQLLDEKGLTSATETTETAASYSILRNHLYTIGKKSMAFPDPDDPSVKEDPEDLNKGEIVVVSVNDKWTEHHSLVIKPQI